MRGASAPAPRVAPVYALVGMPRWLGRRGRWLPARQRVVQPHAGADPQLGEHLPQVPLDGAGAEEQLTADLGVREARPGKARDLLLLRGQLVASRGHALARRRAGGQQLAPGTLGERL